MKSKKGSDVEELSWTPVARGKTYCSPVCGCGCTRADYERAVRDADQLVRRLRGEGWRAVVWENCGWHFKACSGTVQVYGDRRGRGGSLRYSCMISSHVEDPTGGSVLWTNRVPDLAYSDPNRAVRDMFRAAVSATAEVVAALGSAALAAGYLGPLARLSLGVPRLEPVGTSVSDRELAALVRGDRPGRRRA